MTADRLTSLELCLRIPPDSLGFADTSELVEHSLPWVGQDRAERAAHFGLAMEQPDYNLFVLGEVGSGRSSLLLQGMQRAAATRSVPPDLCYLHNFDAPEHPRALRMPAGQGRQFRQLMLTLARTVQTEIPLHLTSEDFKTEADRIRNAYKLEEAKSYAELTTFAEARSFTLFRESGRLVFTLVNETGQAYTEAQARALPKERRNEIDAAEQALRAEITRFMDTMRPLERVMNEALAALRRQNVKPLLDHELQEIRVSLKKQIKDSVKLAAYLDQVAHDVLEHLELFTPADEEEDEIDRREALVQLLASYTVNIVVDNSCLTGAPVIVEQNPIFRALFGSIEYQAEEDVMMTDFSRIRAGSLVKAHGGYLMLHLRDLLADEMVWEKLRRYLRSGRVQIEEPGTAMMPMAAVSLEPEAVDVDVKIVLIGSVEQYYALQEGDPEFARRFRAKVDFAESFPASAATRSGTAVFVAHTCRKLGLPHFSSGAVARLLEDTHREVDDQTRQSANFARIETLIAESAAARRVACSTQTPTSAMVEAIDIDHALAARRLRHDYPEQRLRESVIEGDHMISTQGTRTGQVNGLTQVDLGDWRFGSPVRVTAHTFAGHGGLLNVEREVAMSGPIHDKGVLILQSYLTALFAHVAPLALNASIVFEQEYHGIEGDSASCAELYSVLSSLSGLPMQQGLAVTGALNQHGEVLPVGGINEKIEGWFRICEAQGLDGHQGVVIPERNRRHLMLEARLLHAVEQARFHVYTITHVCDGLKLLTGHDSGLSSDDRGTLPYPTDSVLGRSEACLLAFRRACARYSRGRVISSPRD
jgi:predicted ATP-dependent protease